MKKVIVISWEGCIIRQLAGSYSDSSVIGLELCPGVIGALWELGRETDYHLVLFTRKSSPIVDYILRLFAGEGIVFDMIWNDREIINSWSAICGDEFLDKSNSYFIGVSPIDQPLAEGLGINGIWFNKEGQTWSNILTLLKRNSRKITRIRETTETCIMISLDLNGSGKGCIDTGIPFFDHMLQQMAYHGKLDLIITARGDLQVDEHHTIEDTALLLGHCFRDTLGSKKGIHRYGFVLPMDESRAEVLLDFGGRSWLEWNVQFTRERVGSFPTEMAWHFFSSFCQNAGCNLHITASGKNDHHLLEAIFKAFGRSINMAIQQTWKGTVPSTKGILS